MQSSIFESSITFIVNWIIIIFCLIFFYLSFTNLVPDQSNGNMSTTFYIFTYYFLIFFGVFVFSLGIKAILTSVNAISW